MSHIFFPTSRDFMIFTGRLLPMPEHFSNSIFFLVQCVCNFRHGCLDFYLFANGVFFFVYVVWKLNVEYLLLNRLIFSVSWLETGCEVFFLGIGLGNFECLAPELWAGTFLQTQQDSAPRWRPQSSAGECSEEHRLAPSAMERVERLLAAALMDTQVASESVLATIRVAVLPIAKVFTMCFLGFLMASKYVNVLPASGRKLLNGVRFCTLCSQIQFWFDLNSRKLVDWWVKLLVLQRLTVRWWPHSFR